MKITTNNVHRDITEAHELTPSEREQFDYLNWAAIDDGTDSARFVRYKGFLYDLGEFMANVSDEYGEWHGVHTDSAFTGLLLRFVEDGERCVIARVLH